MPVSAGPSRPCSSNHPSTRRPTWGESRMSPGAACPSSRMGSDSVSPSGKSRAVGLLAWHIHQHLAKMHGHPHYRTGLPPVRGPGLCELVPDRQGRLHGALRHLLQRLWNAKDGHDRRWRRLHDDASKPAEFSPRLSGASASPRSRVPCAESPGPWHPARSDRSPAPPRASAPRQMPVPALSARVAWLASVVDGSRACGPRLSSGQRQRRQVWTCNSIPAHPIAQRAAAEPQELRRPRHVAARLAEGLTYPGRLVQGRGLVTDQKRLRWPGQQWSWQAQVLQEGSA